MLFTQYRRPMRSFVFEFSVLDDVGRYGSSQIGTFPTSRIPTSKATSPPPFRRSFSSASFQLLLQGLIISNYHNQEDTIKMNAFARSTLKTIPRCVHEIIMLSLLFWPSPFSVGGNPLVERGRIFCIRNDTLPHQMTAL